MSTRPTVPRYQRLKATHIFVVRVLLKVNSLNVSIVTLIWPFKILNSSGDVTSNAQRWTRVVPRSPHDRTPSISFQTSAFPLHHEGIVLYLPPSCLGVALQRIYIKQITGTGSRNIPKRKINYIYHGSILLTSALWHASCSLVNVLFKKICASGSSSTFKSGRFHTALLSTPTSEKQRTHPALLPEAMEFPVVTRRCWHSVTINKIDFWKPSIVDFLESCRCLKLPIGTSFLPESRRNINLINCNFSIKYRNQPVQGDSNQSTRCKRRKARRACAKSNDESWNSFMNAWSSAGRDTKLGSEKSTPPAPQFRILVSDVQQKHGVSRRYGEKDVRAKTLNSQTAIRRMALRKFVSAIW